MNPRRDLKVGSGSYQLLAGQPTVLILRKFLPTLRLRLARIVSTELNAPWVQFELADALKMKRRIKFMETTTKVALGPT